MADRRIGRGISPLVTAPASAGLVSAATESPLVEAEADAGLMSADAQADRWLIGETFGSFSDFRVVVGGEDRVTVDGELRAIF